MARQSVLTYELLATRALVWLDSAVDFCVSLEVMRTDECLFAMNAHVRSVTEMSLNMRANVLPSLESGFVASVEQASERVGGGIVLNQSSHLLG